MDPPAISELPESVWKQILGSLALPDRLRCITVSSKLHRAASAATDSVAWTVPEHMPYQQACFTQWLAGTHHNITSLELTNARRPPLQQLCCPRLQQLVLQQCSVCLAGTEQQLGLIQGLQQHMTLLSLQFCSVVDGLSSLTALTALSNLRHLVCGALLDANGQGLRQLSAVDLLPRLKRLTHLEISKRLVLSAPSIQGLSSLSELRTLVLQFRSCSDVSAAALGALSHCPRLQRLEISHPGTPLDLSTAPFMGRAPPALLQFKLAHGTLDLHALASLTQLQQLELSHVQLLPGGAALLALLPALKQLQHLRLGFLQCPWPPLGEAQYSAITASRQLRHLEISGCLLPAGAWQHVFPADARLPHLSSVLLGHVGPRPTTQSQPAMAAADVARLAQCCPALQELQLWRQLQPGATLQGLQQLPALTRLWMSDVGPGVLRSLGAVTGLRDVYLVMEGDPPAATQLQQLTALRQLTRLMAHVRGGPGSVSVSNSASEGSPPDVWLQLSQMQAEQLAEA